MVIVGVYFIVINTQYYKDGSQVEDIKSKQDKWFDNELVFAKTCGAQHVVLFQHIPWFFGNVDEKNDYFNIEIDTRKTMIKKIKEAGIKYIFAGHYHRNAGGFDGDLEMVVTSAIGQQINNDKDSGLRVVCIKSDKITHKYYELDHIPNVVEL